MLLHVFQLKSASGVVAASGELGMLQGSLGAEWCISPMAQAARDGITQFRDSLSDTNKRVGLSAERINGSLGGYVSKKYWCTPVCS